MWLSFYVQTFIQLLHGAYRIIGAKQAICCMADPLGPFDHCRRFRLWRTQYRGCFGVTFGGERRGGKEMIRQRREIPLFHNMPEDFFFFLG